MTDQSPIEKSRLPQQYSQQQKCPLTCSNNVLPTSYFNITKQNDNINNIYNNINNNNNNNTINNNNNNINNNNNDHNNEIVNTTTKFTTLNGINKKLRNNVHIVLNNFRRNTAFRETIINNQYNNNKNNINNNIYNNNTINKNYINMMASPESDCNSNNIHIIGPPLGCSITSSQDFTHDNSDYQWFLDYGYREGVTHQSILSSLSASYNGIGELSYYEDMAKNIDANLAEVDMESFRTEDMHSLLSTTIPSLCKEKTKRGQNENGVAADLDNSICKSKQLFSPVKESVLSVDSLDLDCYGDDGDIILTCQANKNNYTIAFEQSALYSDESLYDGQHDIQTKLKYLTRNSNNIDDIIKRKALDVSMSKSDTGLTTWSKLKKSNTTQLQRYPSGNNNTSINVTVPRHPHTTNCFVRKSSSLPNLQLQQIQQLNASQTFSNSTVDSYGKIRYMMNNNLHQQQLYNNMPVSSASESDSPIPLHYSSSCNSDRDHHHHHHHHNQPNNLNHCNHQHNHNNINQENNNQPSFNLVKLFIKQKSSSTDTCMDVSSGCWPSDSSSSVEQRQRKKSMNDSGKGSALSKHDEDVETDFQYDSLDVPNNANIKTTNVNMLHERYNNINSCNNKNKNNYEYQNILNNNNNNNIINNNIINDNDINDNNTNNNNNNTIDNYQHNNKNNSFSQQNNLNREVFDSPIRCKYNINNNNNNNKMNTECNLNIRNQSKQIFNVNNNNNNNINNNNSYERDSRDSLKETNKSLSDASRTSENLTQIYTKSTKSPYEMVTRSMQTSTLMLRDRIKVIPPSFLAQLNSMNNNKIGEKQPAPVYVIYPNYALPDLGFVKNNNHHSDIVLSPLGYKEAFSTTKKCRPSSLLMDNMNALKLKEYKHVIDWKSLAALLPLEYRKMLRHIPDIDIDNTDVLCAQRPMFCMSPPLRRNRPLSCDCAQMYLNNNTNNNTLNTSSSGSSQPPSSGFRGSSTLISDSDIESATGINNNNNTNNTSNSNNFNNNNSNINEPLKNMYVYQYENNRMENDAEQPTTVLTNPERPPSGRPRGILRRNSTKTKSSKRNSMNDDLNQHKINNNNNNTPTTMMTCNNLDKRRSLQEPYYQEQNKSNIIEDYLNEINDFENGITKPTLNRLNNSRISLRQYQYPIELLQTDDINSKLNRTNLKYIMELNENPNHRRQRLNANTIVNDSNEEDADDDNDEDEIEDEILNENGQHTTTTTTTNNNTNTIDGTIELSNKQNDINARIRAEHFLCNIPKSELKYYAEIANLLESIDNSQEPYDRNKLRNEVSRALSQKRVSFGGHLDFEHYNGSTTATTMTTMGNLNSVDVLRINNNTVHSNNTNNNNNTSNGNINPNLLNTGKEFTTPPNSPNISMATAVRMEKKLKNLEKEKQAKIQSNRFKRLKIQWELLSRESQTLENELIKETRSGGSTPTTNNAVVNATLNAPRSKIPRPVSYPSPKITPQTQNANKNVQSPSRMVLPKKYNLSSGTNTQAVTTSPSSTTATVNTTVSPTTPRPRTPSKLHNTPKKTALRQVTRTR